MLCNGCYVMYDVISMYMLSVDLTVSRIIPELEELLKDEEKDVKLHAYDTLVMLLSYIPSSCRKTRIIPLLRAYCQHEQQQ